jgi:hypothetical protein
MGRSDKTYTLLPTEEDRIIVTWRITRGIITAFTVQYDSYINAAWVEISRIDTCHGQTHRHLFSPSGKDHNTPFFCNNLNEGFTEAKRFITENFAHLKDNYLTQLSKERL